MNINIIDMVLTIILISIPEVYLLTYIILSLLKEYRFFYKGKVKEGFIKIGIFIVLQDSLFTIITFYLDIDLWIRVLMNSTMLAVLIYSILGYFGKESNLKEQFINIMKVYAASIIAFILLIFLELISFVIPQYVFGNGLIDLRTIPFTNFILVIPKFIIMFFIIYINYVNINISKSMVMNIIWKEKKLFKKIIFSQIGITILMYIGLYNDFIKKNVLLILNKDIRIFIILFIYTIMVIGNLLPWFIIYKLKLKQANALKENLE